LKQGIYYYYFIFFIQSKPTISRAINLHNISEIYLRQNLLKLRVITSQRLTNFFRYFALKIWKVTVQLQFLKFHQKQKKYKKNKFPFTVAIV